MISALGEALCSFQDSDDEAESVWLAEPISLQNWVGELNRSSSFASEDEDWTRSDQTGASFASEEQKTELKQLNESETETEDSFCELLKA